VDVFSVDLFSEYGQTDTETGAIQNVTRPHSWVVTIIYTYLGAQVWHAFLRDLTVLPAHPAFIR